MKSQAKRSDLPVLPGTNAKISNKVRPSSKGADAKVENKSDKVDTDGEKKQRRSVLKQKSVEQDDNVAKSQIIPSIADNINQSGNLPFSLDRFGQSHSVSTASAARSRPLINSVSTEIEGNGIGNIVVNGPRLSATNSFPSRRRPSLKPDQDDTHVLESSNVIGDQEISCPAENLDPSIKQRRRSLQPDDGFPEITISESLKHRRRPSLAPSYASDDSTGTGQPRSRQASALSMNSNTKINGSMLKMDEKSMSNGRRQPSLLKEASDIINVPQRVLPGGLMEKYSSAREQILKSQEVKRAEPEEEVLTPSQEELAQKEEEIEILTQVSSAAQMSKAKRLWKKAYCHTVCGLGFLSLYEELRVKGMNIQRAKALEAEGLSVLLSAPNTSKVDRNISARIKELTSKEDRSDEDVEALEKILFIINRAFGRFSLDQRLNFCKICKYEYYKGERMIVKEGHASWAFYFILSGQVKDNLKYRLNVIGPGTSFGDRTMNMLNDKRTASVASTMDIEMLKIDKTDFFDIVNVRDEKGIASRSAKILQIQHFSKAPGGFVEKIAPFVQVIAYEPNEYILREGAENNKIFWLLKGTCQCIKMLPFTKKIVNQTYAGKNVQVSPFVAGETVLEPGEEFFYEFVTTHEVESGDNFVDLPIPPGGSLSEHCFYVNKKDYLEHLKTEDPSDLNSKAAVSVVAKTKVEVICMNRVDYAGLATSEMILSIINSKDIYRIPLLQLQDSYLTARKWNAYKKKVVADVVTKTKRKEWTKCVTVKFAVLKMRSFLSQQIAQSIDIDLMDPKIGGFVIEQLMELAGLSCAQVIQKEYDATQFKTILVCAGPGNNGGDALVAARHLSHFGYSPSVICPKLPDKTLFQNLVTQCKNLNIPFLDGPISHHLLNHSLILDGIFGFSFKGTIRAPFDEIISSLKSCKIPIVSIDIPSGWDVELGNVNGNGLQPSLLISLTYPKKCASKFTGKHYIGGRFLPDFIAKKYCIQSPNFPNADQFVDIKAFLE